MTDAAGQGRGQATSEASTNAHTETLKYNAFLRPRIADRSVSINRV